MKILVLGAALGVTACSTPGMIDTGRVSIITAEQAPEPTLADLSRGARTHIVGPFDRLSVEVVGIPELSRQVQVDASGNIALPVAGNVDVTGQTPVQLEQAIAQRLRQGYVRDPQVVVGVLETVSQVVTVSGQVRQAGIYPVAGPMTLMRAIARAGGATDLAATNRVVLFRTVNGQQVAILHDVRSIERGAYLDPPIYPQDLVVVGESQARRLFPQLIQGAGLLLSPLITILNNN